MQIFELFGTVLLKDEGVASKLDTIDKKASGTSRSMGLSFGSIAKAALGVASILGAGMGIKGMLDAANTSQQRLAQMDAVLKSTGGSAGMTKDELLKLADAQSKITTYSKSTNMETENLLLTFTGLSKKVFPDVLKATNDMATAMGTDTKSAAMQLGKALNDPAAGVSKLTKVGVTFTQQQKDQIAAMEKAGNTAGAQKIMLQELEKEFGGSAEAAGKTFGGQLKILQNQITGVGASIMNNVMPYLQGFIKTVSDNMPKIKQTISDVIGAIVPRFQAWMSLLGQIASQLFPEFTKQIQGAKGKADSFKSALDGVTNVLTFVKNNMGLVKGVLALLAAAWAANTAAMLIHNAQLTIANVKADAMAIKTVALAVAHGVHSAALGIATAAQWLFNAALDANPIGIVIIAIGALIAAVVLIATHWQQVSSFLSNSFNAIVNFFKNNWQTILLFLVNPFAGAFKLLYDKCEGFRNFVNVFLNAIKEFAINTWNGIKSVLSTIGNFFKGIWDGVVNVFNGFVEFIKKWGKTILAVIFWPFSLTIGLIIANWSKISAFFQKVWNDIAAVFSVVVSFFKGIWDGIVAIFTPVVTFFQGVFSAAWEGIKAVWSAVAAFFKNVWDRIVLVFSAVVNFYISIFTAAWNGIKTVWNAVAGFFQGVWSSIVRIFTPIVSWFGGIFRSAYQAVTGAFSAIGSFFTGIFNTVKGIFTKIGTTVGNAIGGAFKSVINSILGFAEKTINGFLSGINGAIGLINKIPGVSIPTLGMLNIPKMNVGTRYLPGDMLIQAHEGEMIVPKSENPYANSGHGETLPQQSESGDIVLNIVVGDNPVKTVRLTSQQIAQAQRQRTSFRTVTV